MGKLKKKFVRENCNYCGLCAQSCKVGAIKVDRMNAQIVFDEDKCNGCGNCVYVCPRDAWKKVEEGYRIFIGGKMGKFPELGVEVFNYIKSKDKVLDIIQKTLDFYKEFGIKGERFRITLNRVGIDKYKEVVK